MRLILPENLTCSDPVIPVQWCLNRHETERLKEVRAQNIQILLVIAYEGTDLEDRYLVPIDQGLAYIQFRRPGKHTLFAKVVYEEFWNRGSTQKLLRKHNQRAYDAKVLNEGRNDLLEHDYLEYHLSIGVLPETSEEEISVPKEYFPAEPPEWLKRIINYGFEYPPVDECSFRRRKLLCLIKVPALALWAVVTTVLRLIIASYLVLAGWRGVDFAPVFHPWRCDISDVYVNLSQRSWFEFDGRRNRRRSDLIYLLHPNLYLILFATVTVTKILLKKSYAELFRMIWLLIANFVLVVWTWIVQYFSQWWLHSVLIVLGAGIAAYFLARTVDSLLRRGLEDKNYKLSEEYQAELERSRNRQYDELYKQLACVKAPKTPSLANLPKEKQTLHLKYLGLKAKVCRPFASR